MRQTLRSRRWLAALSLAAALVLRVFVPAGFMPSVVGGHVTVTICPGVAPSAPMAAMPGMPHDRDAGGDLVGSPCAYADLALPALGAADPALAVAALVFAFVLALLRAAVITARTPARLRPPLRGPPLPV